MKSALKSFFLNKTVLVLCVVLALCLWVIGGLLCLESPELLIKGLDSLAYIGLISGLLIAYRGGETNIQKALIGALLMLLCRSTAELMWESLESGDKTGIILDAAAAVLSVVIFVAHLTLQSDHVGVKSSIILNQGCAVIIVLLFVCAIRQAYLAAGSSEPNVVFIPGWAMTYLSLVCMETRIQEYKRLRAEGRESGTWTEEKRREAKGLFKI